MPLRLSSQPDPGSPSELGPLGVPLPKPSPRPSRSGGAATLLPAKPAAPKPKKARSLVLAGLVLGCLWLGCAQDPEKARPYSPAPPPPPPGDGLAAANDGRLALYMVY